MAYLVPVSYSGCDLNTSSLQTIFAPREIAGTLEMRAILARVADSFPQFTGVDIQPRTIGLWVFLTGSDIAEGREEILRIFDPLGGPGTLVAQDGAGNSRQITVRVRQVAPHPDHPRGIIVTMDAATGVWEAVAPGSASEVIETSPCTISLSVGGNTYALPTIRITVSGSATSASIQRWMKPFYVQNSLSTLVRNFPVEVTGGGWNTSALVESGSMRSDGNDITVYWNDQVVDRWLVDMNSTSTRVWAVLDIPPDSTTSGYVAFGDLSASTPSTDDTRKPLFSLSESGNGTWVFDTFMDEYGGTRPFNWEPVTTYDPLRQYDWHQWNSHWRPLNREISPSTFEWASGSGDIMCSVRDINQGHKNSWQLSLPVTICAVRLAGEMHLHNESPRGIFTVEYLARGSWQKAWEESTDYSAAWTEFSASISLSDLGATGVRMGVPVEYLGGSQGTPIPQAGLGHFGFKITSVSLFIPDSAIQVSSSPPFEGNRITASLTNTTLADSPTLEFDLMVEPGQTVLIDTACQLVKNETTGQLLNHILRLDTLRRDWLPLAPCRVNTLRYAQSQLSGYSVTLAVEWKDRWL